MGGVKAMTDAIITAASGEPDRTAQKAHAAQFKKAEEDWEAYLESSSEARDISKRAQLAAFGQSEELLGLMSGGENPYAAPGPRAAPATATPAFSAADTDEDIAGALAAQYAGDAFPKNGGR